MKQSTLASTGFEVHRKATRKAEFLSRMDRLIPWTEFCNVIEPYYPKAGNGRPPIGLDRMLRMYFIAHWFNLADEACEDALYDLPAFREFCRIDLGRERVPDATSLLNFRHLLETHDLGAALFAKVGEFLQQNGFRNCRVAPSLMRPSSLRPARPRMPTGNVTRRCTRPRRATSGTLA